jgi:hypothetical protein
MMSPRPRGSLFTKPSPRYGLHNTVLLLRNLATDCLSRVCLCGNSFSIPLPTNRLTCHIMFQNILKSGIIRSVQALAPEIFMMIIFFYCITTSTCNTIDDWQSTGISLFHLYLHLHPSSFPYCFPIPFTCPSYSYFSLCVLAIAWYHSYVYFSIVTLLIKMS